MFFFLSRPRALLRHGLHALIDHPAIAAGLVGLALAPVALIGAADPATGGPHLLAALWLLFLLAGLALRRTRARLAAPPPLLLTRRALSRPPLPLPPALRMRAELAALLSSPAPRAGTQETAEHAVRRVLERCLARSGGGTALEALDRPAMTELWLLATLLRASPERAGALAQCFHRPHRILALRDQMPSPADVRRAARPRLALIRSQRGPQLSA